MAFGSGSETSGLFTSGKELGTFTHGPKEYRRKALIVTDLAQAYRDSTGQVWLGYSSGQLHVIRGDQAIAYSQKDGLDLGRIKVVRGLGRIFGSAANWDSHSSATDDFGT